MQCPYLCSDVDMDNNGSWLPSDLSVPLCRTQRNHLIRRRHDREWVSPVGCSLALEFFQHGGVVGSPVDKDMIDAHLCQSV